MNNQHVTSSGYSSWQKRLSGQAISEIRSGSYSGECNEISQNTSVLVTVVALAVKRKYLLSWRQAQVIKEHWQQSLNNRL
jgi:hypothetical protein